MGLNAYYSTGHLMSASSSWTDAFRPVDTLTFGFPARTIHICNSCGDRLWFNLASAATTLVDFVRGCSELLLQDLPGAGYQEVTGLSLLTSSSSCTSRPLVGITAWGSA